MKILIGADLVPTKSNYEKFENGNIETIVDKSVLSLLNEDDYKIFNLETPLTNKKTPIKKNGPNLIAPVETIKGIKKIGVDLFTCANNHIMDQGVDGLKSTIKTLVENNISFSGIGHNVKEASKPFLIEMDGKKVGVYCCTEHEFSIATNTSLGANPYNPLYSFDHISSIRRKVDYLIVLYHGGKEHYRYPSPMLQEVCHRFVDVGANLVVCQHSHCIGCEEKYHDSTIVYGQGNFIFDLVSNEYWNTSLLIEIDTNDNYKIRYIPLEKNNGKILISNDESILDNFYKRSNEIKRNGFVDEEYKKFAMSMKNEYLLSLSGHRSILARAFNKITKGLFYKHLINKKYKESNLLQLRNYVECEAHNELLKQILNLSKEKK